MTPHYVHMIFRLRRKDSIDIKKKDFNRSLFSSYLIVFEEHIVELLACVKFCMTLWHLTSQMIPREVHVKPVPKGPCSFVRARIVGGHGISIEAAATTVEV